MPRKGNVLTHFLALPRNPSPKGAAGAVCLSHRPYTASPGQTAWSPDHRDSRTDDYDWLRKVCVVNSKAASTQYCTHVVAKSCVCARQQVVKHQHMRKATVSQQNNVGVALEHVCTCMCGTYTCVHMQHLHLMTKNV